MSAYRKYTRLIDHDYSGADYFITVCTHNRIHYLGEIINAEMDLSGLGKFLKNNIENISSHFCDIEIPLYVVMPNHFHAVISIVGSRALATAKIDDSQTNNLGKLNQLARLAVATGRNPTELTHHNSRLAVVVGSIKSAVTRYARRNNLQFDWQRGFHDHIIRNNRDGNLIADYIKTNPQRWDLDCYNE